jgi:hypothetical protein
MSAADTSASAAPTRRSILLATGAVGLLAAVFLTPFRLASAWADGYPDVAALSHAMSAGFVSYWHTGAATLGPDLTVPVDYWARFHVLKACLAALLLIVLVPLGGRIWSSYTSTARAGHRLLIAALGAVHACLTVLALLVLVANVQGAIAPLSSALGLMPLSDPDPALAATLSQIHHALVTGHDSAALDTLVRDYGLYHAAMAAIGAAVTLLLLTSAVVLWRRRTRVARNERRSRRVLLTGAASLLLLTAFFAIITAANLATAAHPAPALLGFFEGGS